MSGGNINIEPQDVPKVQTKFRTIKTQIPTPDYKEFFDELEEVESRSMHGQLPIIWDKAYNFSLEDKLGNKWIDFTSTIFVANTGHANERLVSYVKKQLDDQLVHSYAYVTEIRKKYLKKLIECTPKFIEKAFLMSAGTEATEAAVKLMCLHAQRTGKKKSVILSLEGNWHGRTMGAQLLSTNENQKAWIPFKSSFNKYLKFPYPWALGNISEEDFFDQSLEALTKEGINPKEDIAGIMLETFQGWGAWFYPAKYIQKLKKFCEENNILICFDEMQSGFGRTGTLFGYEHYKIEPDLICVGKGMAAGLPLSGVLGRAKILDLPDVGDMSSTHSANPLVCAAGLATLEELIDYKMLENSIELGEIFGSYLNKLQEKYPALIKYVCHKGMLAALHFYKDGEPAGKLTSQIAMNCLQKGLLVVHTGRESIKMAPPLSISKEALVEGLEVLEESIEQALND
jgi:4-aminobutyrate aminotransferase-like enzyme